MSKQVEPVIADEVFEWMVGITERGEYLKLLLKGLPPGYEREAMLASTLRLLEKCWEEMAELEAQTRGRDGHSLVAR